MNRNLLYYLSIVIISGTLIFSLSSCKKNKTDYRNEFVGTYNFTVIHNGWSIIGPPVNDTIYYTGTVGFYTAGQTISQNTYGCFSTENSPEKRIIINFQSNTVVIPTIGESGALEGISGGCGINFEFSGNIVGETISFTTSSYGNGGGSSYEVSGVKVP